MPTRLPGRSPRTPEPRRADLLLAAGLSAVGLVEAVAVLGADRLAGVAVVSVLTVPLLWRRAHPALVSLIVSAGFVVQLAWPPLRSFDVTFTCYVALLLAAYSLGRFGRQQLWAAVPALVVGGVIGIDDGSTVSGLLAAVLVLAAAGLGRTVALRTELRELLEAQAAELAASGLAAEEAAAAAVRAHIAGEVQDVVHRHVERMLSDSREARGPVHSDPARATELIGRVEARGREALDEMRRMLGLLRRGAEAAPLLPAAAHVQGPRLPRAVSEWLAPAVLTAGAAESAWSAAQAGASRETVVAACLGGALIAAPLFVRRAHPLAATVAGWTAACVVVAFVPLPALALTLTAPLLAYAAGAHAGRLGSPLGLAVGGAGIVAVNLVAGGAGMGDYVVPAVLVGLAWLAGRAVAEQVAMARTVTEQNRELERLREIRAEAASAEERLRIARELHDVLAHTLMVMVVQAGAARRTLESDPARSRAALAVVVETGDGALTELRRLLSVVDPSASPSSSGLGGLASLVERARASGLVVDLRTTGPLDAVPGGVDLAAYRIVQEALTNVIRHAGARSVAVCVEAADGRLAVRVRDDGRSPAGVPGNGIAGMRERVRIYGGEFAAGPSSSGFVVAASFPLGVVAAEQPA